MNFDFNDCYWHDSILKNIFIDRSDPGNVDTVEMTIDWYDEPESKIIFRDVYLFKATLNFGIIADETILNAEIAIQEDPDLINFYQKAKGVLASKKINCYIIETNSTGGTIKILAETVEKVPL
ncbi:hypothetical protein [[Flexibacter] sp. ATCC 35208]|uniref:hypothetical protein n=1 Tax=[Flexibacter] sp. ATCC 35208 TaxID=1936242 RepID=UPI0009D4079C|nr:hypothetical protein [[Flexibacter] sp. ATCC 35208]OMP76231.1 hypothetical protein BW716_25980 [[Flexibacter] sp. ATCC 35208]